MSPISKLAGFPVEAGSKIYVNGQRYRVGVSGRFKKAPLMSDSKGAMC